MRLLIMRHTEREERVDFTSPLTARGVREAERVARGYLASARLEAIYASPFIRTIQTAAPFCAGAGLTMRLDYALHEDMNPAYIQSHPSTHVVPDWARRRYPIAAAYRPAVDIGDIAPVEGYDQVRRRLSRLLSRLRAAHRDARHPILLCTHMAAANGILQLTTRRSVDIYADYDEGEIREVIVED